MRKSLHHHFQFSFLPCQDSIKRAQVFFSLTLNRASLKLSKQALQELIDQLLNKVDKPVKKLSNRRRKAIAKKQANTTMINKKGIVSLIKK